MVFHWTLRDSKSPLVSSTPLSILVNLNKTTVSIVSNFQVRQSLDESFGDCTVHTIIRVFVIIIIYSLEFFTSVLADGLSLEFGWQQVSSSLQDSSQYSGQSQ